MSFDWIPTRISVLIALWDEGVTTSEIGRRLGVTKNAVVGKAHRLGLPLRRPPVQAKPVERRGIGLEDLGYGMCSWPDGDPATKEFGFCGRQVVPAKPYCAAHCARAYTANTRDRKSPVAA